MSSLLAAAAALNANTAIRAAREARSCCEANITRVPPTPAEQWVFTIAMIFGVVVLLIALMSALKTMLKDDGGGE